MISKNLLYALPCLFVLVANGRADPYDQYLKKKQEWYSALSQRGVVQEGSLSQKALEKQENQANEELSPLLKSLIGEVKFRTPSTLARVQPESRGPGNIDSGCVDGLVYTVASEEATVSNVQIVKEWTLFRKEKFKSPFNLKDLSLYSTDFACDDAHHTNMGDLNLPALKGFDHVYGYLALVAQDIGAFSPNAIDVYAQQGERLFFVSLKVDDTQTKIPSCLQIWKDSEAQNMDVKKEEATFDRLTACYQDSLPKSALQKRFNKIAQEQLNKLF